MMEEIEFNTISKVPSCIVVQNAYKRYGQKTIVLNGLDLMVPVGGIYGLLGPSGCGKTTLLNCIVGQIEMDYGSVWLNVKRRSEIGFMPQTVSLHESMTIFENFFFYGYLFGMCSRDIQSRAIDLIALLELPSGHRCVGDLSGGQRRRISMAVTIIHDPKILILDEPTAGLDPILTHSVWQHLKQMASTGKTIIVTTHYIQEVQQADRVGIMRNGILLTEDCPQMIMTNCGCASLEDAFLMLSEKQEGEKKKNDYIERLEPTKVKFEEDQKFFSAKKFNALMYKNVKQTRREYTFQLLILMLPVVTAVFFSIAIGRYPKHLRLAVVNEESTCHLSSQSGCFLDEKFDVRISCMILEALKNQTYETITYNNDAAAWDDLKKSRAFGLLHFKKNYTRSLAMRMNTPELMTEERLIEGFIDSRIDSSNFIISEVTIKRDLFVSLMNVLRRAIENCDLNPKILQLPPIKTTSVWNTQSSNFVSYVASTLLILTSFTTPSLASSLQMFTEKSLGILERMMITGVSLKEIILVVMIIQLITIFIQNILVLTVMFGVFDNPMRGSYTTLFSLAVLTGISGVSYGIVLALINYQFMFMAFFGISINMFLCYTTGLFWPVEAAHKLLKSINWMIPLSASVDAAHGISSRNLSLSNASVMKGFFEGFVWNVIFLLLICVIVRHKKRN